MATGLGACGDNLSEPAQIDAAHPDAAVPDADAAFCVGSAPRVRIDGVEQTIASVRIDYDGIGCCDGMNAVFGTSGATPGGFELRLLSTSWQATTAPQAFDLASPSPVLQRRLASLCPTSACPSVDGEGFSGWFATQPNDANGMPRVSLCVRVDDVSGTHADLQSAELYLRDVPMHLP